MDFISDTKPIWSTIGLLQHTEWILFSAGRGYTFNGFHYCSAVVPFNETFALPGHQVEVILSGTKEDFCDVYYDDKKSGIKIKDSKGQFSYPFSVEKQLNHFYSDIDSSLWQLCHGFTEALNVCSQTIHKNNIEFSNCYVIDKKMYSTDGIRYSVVETDSISCSIPIGTDKVINNRQIRAIQENNTMVSFLVDTYIISATKNIGSGVKIKTHEPKERPGIRVSYTKELVSLFDTAKKFDNEFKLKDLYVEVKFDNNMLYLSITGVKNMFRKEFPVDTAVPFVFKVNPGLFTTIAKDYSSFFYDPGMSYLLFSEGERSQYLWIER
jgi:hypothetical protein